MDGVEYEPPAWEPACEFAIESADGMSMDEASSRIASESSNELLGVLETDVCIQAGGGVHGYPDGTHAGAKALRQAVEAGLEGVPLVTVAEEHGKLATALEKRGAETPR